MGNLLWVGRDLLTSSRTATVLTSLQPLSAAGTWMPSGYKGRKYWYTETAGSPGARVAAKFSSEEMTFGLRGGSFVPELLCVSGLSMHLHLKTCQSQQYGVS